MDTRSGFGYSAAAVVFIAGSETSGPGSSIPIVAKHLSIFLKSKLNHWQKGAIFPKLHAAITHFSSKISFGHQTSIYLPFFRRSIKIMQYFFKTYVLIQQKVLEKADVRAKLQAIFDQMKGKTILLICSRHLVV